MDKKFLNSKMSSSVRAEPLHLTAYSYRRWSHISQSKGDSLRRQSDMAGNVCKEKGWILDESFAPDAGKSAYTGENLESGSLAQFLKAVKERRIKTPCVLVVEALDRLTRTRLREARKLFDGLLESGVRICTAHNGKVYDDSSLDNPFDLFMSLMELKAAHDYSANIGRRVGATWNRKRNQDARQSIVISNNVPAWLVPDRKNNTIKTEPTKAALVVRIFKEYADGKGIRTIMGELNREGVPPFGKGKKNKAKCWSTTHLRRLLTFRGVLGEYQPHKYLGKGERQPDGEPIKDYYPAIVDKVTFYRVQERLSKNGHSSGPKRNATNLFTGKIKCAKCGSSMFIKQSGMKAGKYSYVSLICSNTVRKQGCPHHTIIYSKVERALLTMIWMRILPVMAQEDKRQSELDKLKAELKDIEIKVSKISNQIEIDGVLPECVFKVLIKFEARQKTLAQEIEALSAVIQANPLHGWEPIVKTVDNRLRLQSILSNEIEFIKVDASEQKAEIKVNGMNDPITVAWEDSYKDGFYIVEGGERYQQAYLDDVLVWKTDHNFKITSIKAVDTDRPVVFAVEREQGVYAVVV